MVVLIVNATQPCSKQIPAVQWLMLVAEAELLTSARLRGEKSNLGKN